MNDYIREFLEYIFQGWGEKILHGFVALPYNIAKSYKLLRLFTLAGFSLFSGFLIYGVMAIVNINENIRTNEEKSRNSSLSIQTTFDRVNDLLILLEKNCENNTLSESQSQFERLKINGYAQIIEGKFNIKFGNLDPTCSTDSMWNAKRWQEIENNIKKFSTNVPTSFFVSYERRFRTKQEVLSGSQYMGSIVLARTWMTKGQLNGNVVIFPISNFSQYLRLDGVDYESGNYDYIVDQDGHVLCHPRLFILNGTDKDGINLKSARNEQEVGLLPINTRDANWIAGNDKLDRAFGKMLKGEFSSLIYNNLKNQPRLTSFNKIPLADNNISGNIIGVVTGKGLSKIDSYIGPFLLQSPNALYSTMYSFITIFMILIVGWFFLFNRIRLIHRDLLELSSNMSAESANRLNLLPIQYHQSKGSSYPNSVAILLTVESLKNLEDAILIKAILKNICLLYQQHGFVTDEFEMNSVLVFFETHPKNNPSILFPLPILNLFQTNEVKVLLNNFGKERFNNIRINIHYIIGDINLNIVKHSTLKKITISIGGKAISDLMTLREISKGSDANVNQVNIICDESISKEIPIEAVGKEKINGEHKLYISYRKLI